MDTKIQSLALSFVIGLLGFCGLSTSALAEEADWSDTMNVDHPGFSDSASLMSLGRFQIESGMEFTEETASTNWLARYGLFDWMELRFEVPAIISRYGSPGVYNVDVLEAGPKVQLHNSDRLSFSVIPSVLFPAGSKDSSAKLISVGLELLTDIRLNDQLTTSIGVYSRALGQAGLQKDTYVYQLESTLVAAVAWSLTKQFAMVVDGWVVFDDLTSGSKTGSIPGLDLALSYLFTPNVSVDVYGGVTFAGSERSSFGGFGVSVRP